MFNIYIAFANDSRASLELSKEKRQMENYFLPLESKGLLNLVQRDPVQLVDMAADFINFEHKIELIHFSGHGSAQQLYFELLGKETQAASALGLASFMGKQRGLKLLVLNACSTFAQAERLHQAFSAQNPDLPLPAVIATRRPVKDDAACLFSQYFYHAITQGRTVDEAFVHARQLLQAHYGGSPNGFRDVYFEGQEEETGTDFPWVLLPGARAGWQLSGITTQQGLGELQQHTCNRELQETGFQAAYSQNQTLRAQFYVLHGPERQAHGSLPKRFRYEISEGEKATVLPVLLQEASDLSAYKANMLLGLFKALEKNQPKIPLAELTYARLQRIAQSLGYKEVLVNMMVESSCWKPFTADLLRWFSDEFCQNSQEQPGTPRFLFFLSVIYTPVEVPKSGGLFKNLFSKPKDPNEELEKALQQLPYMRLEKLAPVKPSDIDKWVANNNISEYKTHQEKIRAAYFEPKDVYNMEDVELALRKIINDYNEKKPKIWDIIE